MDRQHFSKIRHSSLQFCSPVRAADVADIAERICPISGRRFVEIGCGKAEILARLLDLTNSTGLGIDLPGSLAENLSPLATQMRNSNRLELQFQDGGEFVAKTDERFDVVIVSGSSQAVGGFGNLPVVAEKLLESKGWLVLGELAWRAQPDAELLLALGMSEGDLPYASAVPEILQSKGLKNLHWTVIQGDQFFQYERALFENGMTYASSRPDDIEAREIGIQSEKWFALMNQFGLKAFSFGWGLFQKGKV
jgi:cyclopropane fatty-acyl-phospholipid synthase-like methyltransferase